jgi:hypothetical protein
VLNVPGLFRVLFNKRLVSKYGDSTGRKVVGDAKLNTKHLTFMGPCIVRIL